MKLSKASLAIPLVAVMLVVAAGVVIATPGNPKAPVSQAPAAATPTPAPSAPVPSAGTKPGWGGMQADDGVLADVLDDLVAKGTITAAQKQAILDGVTTERKARQEARQEAFTKAREQAKADAEQLKDFLADGVITKAEFDKLPADSYVRKLTSLMDDGKITSDELKEIGRNGPGGKGGHGWFGGWGHGDKDAKPSASPSTGS